MSKSVATAAAITRPLDKLGRIVIPMEYRRNMGWETNDTIAVTAGEGGLFLSKYEPGCACGCMDQEQLVFYNRRFFCRACIKKLAEMARIQDQDE